MSARIFQRPKNAMQSGSGRREWVLEHVPAEPRKADPLMGWAGSGDTQAQVQLTFPSLDAARAYAEKKGIVATFIPTPPPASPPPSNTTDSSCPLTFPRSLTAT